MEVVKDYVGNVLEIGDDVVVMSSGNSSWRKGKVTGFKDSWNGIKVQVEYNDHYYCNLKHYELTGALTNPNPTIKFKMKSVRVSIDTYNVVKLLPEYLED